MGTNRKIKEVQNMKKILLTCFDPFGDETINPSQLAVAKLPDKIAGAKIIKLEVPTIFKKSKAILYEMLKKEMPDAVICIGQAGGRSNISVERVAINIDDARIPDNEGAQPIDEPVVGDGPAAYFSTLPIKAIVQNCNHRGISAAISNTAGTFVCNHLMYAACHYAEKFQPNLKAGFIHIPFVPEQIIDKPQMPAMTCTEIVDGLESMVKTVIEVKEDVLTTTL